jgi:hypothetical protein
MFDPYLQLLGFAVEWLSAALWVLLVFLFPARGPLIEEGEIGGLA